MRLNELTEDRRQAVARLTDSTRELMRAVAVADGSPEELTAARALIEQATSMLAESRRPRILHNEVGVAARARVDRVPYRANVANPLHVPLEVHFDGEEAWAELTADASLEGPKGSLNGATICGLMDIICGLVVQARPVPAVTGTLSTRFLSATPLEAPLQVRSRIAAREGRKLTVEGWIEHDGQRTVQAHAVFIEVDPALR